MKHKPSMPPHFLRVSFAGFAKEDIYSELQGDLEEEFHLNSIEFGLKTARKKYRREVLKMIRPSVIRRLKTSVSLYNHTAMFRNYTLIAIRNISRNKLFSGINILGMSISMAVGLLAITFLQELYSYDNFHENADRIYRVINTTHEAKETGYYASTSPVTGNRIRDEYAGAEKVVTIQRNFNADIKMDDEIVSVSGLYATNEFFDIFSFPWLQGNQTEALNAPNSLVLTESAARRIFNSIDVTGEIVQLRNGRQYTITGVVLDPPRKSHMTFEAIASFSTLERLNRSNSRFMSWTNMWDTHVYLLMRPNTRPEQLSEYLSRMAEEENARLKTWSIEPGIQPLGAIFPGKKLFNEIGARMDIKTVQSIVFLAIVVLASACFNYTNLTIARSLKRAKEVGVRKVIGAKKSQLLMQFIFEAMVVSLFSLLIAYLLFRLSQAEFITLDRNIQRNITLETTFSTFLYFFIFSLVIGLIAGFLPALVLSKLKLLSLLKGDRSSKGGRGINLRKVLIGVQFALSLGFVMLVDLSFQQYRFALNYNLGFNTENVLNVRIKNTDAQTLKNNLAQIPEISHISASSYVPSIGGLWIDRGYLIEPADTAVVYNLHVDNNYLENLDHELIAGRNFQGEITRDEVIVNEKLLEAFNIDDPSDALGRQLRIQGRTRHLVGVVKDFQFGTIDLPIEPFAFLNDPGEFTMLNLKLSSDNIVATLDKIEDKWDELSPGSTLSASFYEDDIEQAYKSLETTLKTVGLLAFVAIIISLLGLLGMAVYNTQARLKELTIRKVLGANPKNLIKLLSKDFIIMYLIALVLAIPATIYAFDTLVASEMLHVINIGVSQLMVGAMAVLILASLTIGSQTIGVVKQNPVKHLRND